jgi:hypothetical protein
LDCVARVRKKGMDKKMTSSSLETIPSNTSEKPVQAPKSDITTPTVIRHVGTALAATVIAAGLAIAIFLASSLAPAIFVIGTALAAYVVGCLIRMVTQIYACQHEDARVNRERQWQHTQRVQQLQGLRSRLDWKTEQEKIAEQKITATVEAANNALAELKLHRTHAHIIRGKDGPRTVIEYFTPIIPNNQRWAVAAFIQARTQGLPVILLPYQHCDSCGAKLIGRDSEAEKCPCGNQLINTSPKIETIPQTPAIGIQVEQPYNPILRFSDTPDPWNAASPEDWEDRFILENAVPEIQGRLLFVEPAPQREVQATGTLDKPATSKPKQKRKQTPKPKQLEPVAITIPPTESASTQNMPSLPVKELKTEQADQQTQPTKTLEPEIKVPVEGQQVTIARGRYKLWESGRILHIDKKRHQATINAGAITFTTSLEDLDFT